MGLVRVRDWILKLIRPTWGVIGCGWELLNQLIQLIILEGIVITNSLEMALAARLAIEGMVITNSLGMALAARLASYGNNQFSGDGFGY